MSFEELDAGSFASKVGLETAEDDWSCWAEVKDFWIPLDGVRSHIGEFTTETYLVEHVLERIWAVNCEADEEQIRFRI